MSLQEIIYSGTLTSTGSPQYVSIPAGFDEFVLRNRTTLAAGSGIIEAKWWSGMSAGYAETKTVSGGTITDAIISSAGFTYEDDSTSDEVGAATAISGITQASPAVASSGSTPVAGQIVRIYGTTAQLQTSGIDYTVGTVSAGVSFQLAYLDSSGFAAAATAGYWRLVNRDLAFYPRKRTITKITQAASAVVTFSVTHDYVVGSKIRFSVPSAYGMTQLDGLTGTVTAISTTNNTVTVDIDSSGFTAFAWPTSAVYAAGTSLPEAVPAGEVATILTSAIRDTSARRIYLGTAIDGTSADVFDYVAKRFAS